MFLVKKNYLKKNFFFVLIIYIFLFLLFLFRWVLNFDRQAFFVGHKTENNLVSKFLHNFLMNFQ